MAERPIQDVNIELGDDMSKMLYEASKLTYANRPGLLTEFHDSFSGARAMPIGHIVVELYKKDPDAANIFQNLAFDGAGTKPEVAERTGYHATVAHDVFAMVCDDAVVRGAEPVAIGSILDVRQLDDTEEMHRSMSQLAEGYVAAAEKAGVVVVNGELAELGFRINGYGAFNYNWGAGCLWLAHQKRLLTGEQLRPDVPLVGLAQDQGFRSNGLTDVRKGMLEAYGDDWHNKVIPELGSVSLGQLVLAPSTIYSRLITHLNGGYDITKEQVAAIHGVAHITGGGQPSKLGRMLEPSGYGAVIDDPIEPPAVMRHVQELRGFDDRKAYGKWHMGPGMVVATPDPERVLEAATEFGIRAKVIGRTTAEPGIRIKNRGARADDDGSEEYLFFPPKTA